MKCRVIITIINEGDGKDEDGIQIAKFQQLVLETDHRNYSILTDGPFAHSPVRTSLTVRDHKVLSNVLS